MDGCTVKASRIKTEEALVRTSFILRWLSFISWSKWLLVTLPCFIPHRRPLRWPMASRNLCVVLTGSPLLHESGPSPCYLNSGHCTTYFRQMHSNFVSFFQARHSEASSPNRRTGRTRQIEVTSKLRSPRTRPFEAVYRVHKGLMGADSPGDHPVEVLSLLPWGKFANEGQGRKA